METHFGSRFWRMTKVSYFFKSGLHRPQNILAESSTKETSVLDKLRLREYWNKQCFFPIFHIFQGVLIAHTVSHLVRTIMNLHLVLSKPLTKSCVMALCRLTELLKVRASACARLE